MNLDILMGGPSAHLKSIDPGDTGFISAAILAGCSATNLILIRGGSATESTVIY